MLADVADLVRREAGITLSAAQESSLQAALGRAAPGLDAESFLRQTSDPVAGRDLVLRLIDEVTVKETTFLRDREQLTVIDWQGLHRSARAAGSDRIRVWSAGCATGEEPYTLAMLAAGVWLAPDGLHLALDGSRLVLDDGVYPGPHRPSGDVLLHSIARSIGRSAAAIVLTGMGRDGASGAAAVKHAGGIAIAQDEASCVIYGMPKAAVDAGVDLVMTPDELAAAIASLKHAPLAVRT